MMRQHHFNVWAPLFCFKEQGNARRITMDVLRLSKTVGVQVISLAPSDNGGDAAWEYFKAVRHGNSFREVKAETTGVGHFILLVQIK